MPLKLLWRVASTEALLASGYLVAEGIPAPSFADYKDYSASVPLGDGGSVRHGYKSVSLQWEVLDVRQAVRLRSLIQEALDSTDGKIYLTIDRHNATGGGNDWIDVSGYPHMPDWESSSPLGGATGRFYEGVSLFVNNLTVVNDPSLAL